MGFDDETLAVPPKPRFDSTQWSLVVTAQHRSSVEGREAFEKLCEKYWFPLYAFVRQTVQDVHHARDLTQSFFLKVMEKNYIGDADPSRGRFRTFLLASISNFMANEWNKVHAVKRGGDVQHLSREFDEGERWLRNEPDENELPEVVYERRWALALLRHVLQQLRDTYVSSDKVELFEELSPFLNMEGDVSYKVAADRLEMSEGAIRVAAHRLRTQYRDALRKEIANTLADPSETDDEIRRLFRIFSKT